MGHVESENERQLSILATYFPHSFATPTVRATQSAVTTAPNPRHALNSVTLPPTFDTVGQSSSTDVVAPSTLSQFAEPLKNAIRYGLAEFRVFMSIKSNPNLMDDDRRFLIDVVHSNLALSESIPECEVPIFKRAHCDLTIEKWFQQMQAYVEKYNVDRRFWENQCIGRIHPSHIMEIYPFMRYNYLNFRLDCI